MMIAPIVNQTSPTARTHLRPILSARYPEDSALTRSVPTLYTVVTTCPKSPPIEVALEIHSFSTFDKMCPKSSLIETREAEMTPVS